MTVAQGLTGTLIGTVKDEQGGVLAGASVRVSSPALIGGPVTASTDERGRLRFPVLAPDCTRSTSSSRDSSPITKRTSASGLARRSREPLFSRWGASRNRWWLKAQARESKREAADSRRVSVPKTSKRSPCGDSACSTSSGPRLVCRPTSPGNGTTNSVSAFGSGTNENTFLIDGTNFTCPCSGEARAEPGVDFIQEVQVQSVGASAEFGNMQGAVVNVITRQGGDRFSFDTSYYGQSAGLTSQPVRTSSGGFAAERVRARPVS